MGNRFVADQLPFFDATVEIVIENGEIAEIIISDAGVVGHRLVLHPDLHCFRNGARNKQKILIPQRVVGLCQEVMRYKDNKKQVK